VGSYSGCCATVPSNRLFDCSGPIVSPSLSPLVYCPFLRRSLLPPVKIVRSWLALHPWGLARMRKTCLFFSRAPIGRRAPEIFFLDHSPFALSLRGAFDHRSPLRTRIFPLRHPPCSFHFPPSFPHAGWTKVPARGSPLFPNHFATFSCPLSMFSGPRVPHLNSGLTACRTTLGPFLGKFLCGLTVLRVCLEPPQLPQALFFS